MPPLSPDPARIADVRLTDRDATALYAQALDDDERLPAGKHVTYPVSPEEMHVALAELRELRLLFTVQPCGHFRKFIFDTGEGTNCCLVCALNAQSEQVEQLRAEADAVRAENARLRAVVEAEYRQRNRENMAWHG